MGKFNKGDRVKVKHTDYPAFIPVGSTTHIVEIIGGDGVTLWCEQYPSGLTFFPSEFELLPVAATGTTESQPAILQIEAGKFYRTRDGRKVGPMSEDGISEFPWHGTSQGSGLESYRNDGSWSLEAGKPDCRDLIAEWVETPVDDANEKANSLPVTLKFTDGGMIMGVSEFKMPTIKSPSIVARIDNGQPMPAARPLVHDTKEEAEKEAKRLSEKHRGKEFGVFTLIAKHQAEAVYDHEWQRLAANGNKIGAIKAIRELTGFGLKAAKDGLEDWLSRNAA